MEECKIKRTLFDLFRVYSCVNCIYNKKDESLKIGETNIEIYHVYNNCRKDKVSIIDVAVSKKLRLFLKDSILNKNFLILWLDDFNSKKDMYFLYNLLFFDTDIHIICD